ncbi:MAG: VanW family protein [Candidatus Obscuribacterales bacterium]|nr:VanW family protein [Candidatus Obscuribacterales bacterium]
MRKKVTRFALIAAVPIALLVYFMTRPFSQEIDSQTVYIGELSAEQINNVQVAAKALDGIILKPGDVFSFNKAVGPRTFKRGYDAAPSYLNSESPSTFGGGICVVSSAVYQLALSAGFPIIERLPHQKTVRSVLPGLDATVWYGRSDLRFQNNLDTPVQLKASVDHNDVTLKILGVHPKEEITVRRLVTRETPDHIQVEVFRQIKNKTTLVSRDLYALPPRHTHQHHNH